MWRAGGTGDLAHMDAPVVERLGEPRAGSAIAAREFKLAKITPKRE